MLFAFDVDNNYIIIFKILINLFLRCDVSVMTIYVFYNNLLIIITQH